VVKNIESKPADRNNTQYFNSKYSRMREIVVSRYNKDYVSLNKLPGGRQEVYVIGMIRDIREGEKTTLEIEDLSGGVGVLFDPVETKLCQLDDVVAIHAISGGKVLFGKKIFYPDVPVRTPAKGRGRGCFVSDLHVDECADSDVRGFFKWFSEAAADYLFVAGDIGDMKRFEQLCNEFCANKIVFIIPGNCDAEDEYPYLPVKLASKNIVSLSNPAIVRVGGLNVLLIHKFDTEMIRKRHLGDTTVLNDDDLVLDTIPDIIHYGSDHMAFVSNYKSITLVNSGSLLSKFVPVVIDFETRDVRQITI
jgi:DNA polymerase II small subunit